ncbi:unnamed protein product [Anisakis simplex]|uniref:Heme O synthase n=1 Tax=Anisakis simplex TaxID=6269 RepID=A0A0M3K2Z6_ANISI|nr:unnamed protein product [Anisakis simplex]
MLPTRLAVRLHGIRPSCFATSRTSMIAVRKAQPEIDISSSASSTDLNASAWKRQPSTSKMETTSHLHFDLSSLFACVIGTTLLSACANACNHLLEAPYDAQMKRTQARLLVVHRFSPLHAAVFASVVASAGTCILWDGCNSLTAMLGLLNVFLYAGVYTPMKRHSAACTWVGAIVGSIPPLMGYTAATGTLEPAAFALAAVLYCWQFPHFNALSWNHRGDYSRAGYRIMCVTDEALCKRTTLRHSLALLGICSFVVPYSGLTTWSFAFDSLPVNACLLYLSAKFFCNPNAKTSRSLFRYSLVYLPLMMVLMVVSKYGQASATEVHISKCDHDS